MLSFGSLAQAQRGECRNYRHHHDSAGGDRHSSEGASFQFITLDVPSVDFGASAYGINDEGVVSGDYSDTNGQFHGFLWKDGSYVTVDAAGGWADTDFGGINDEGFVIGSYDNGLTESYATFYNPRHQVWTALPEMSGFPWSTGTAVNNRGVAVGFAECSCGTNTSWMCDGTNYSFFVVPASIGSEFGTSATGINDRDEVTGYYSDPSDAFHGFLKRGTNLVTIDVPGASGTQAYGLNDVGDVVGWSWTSGPASGFIKHGTDYITVDFPGADQTEINAINNFGQIAGVYESSGNWYAFVAAPREGRH
jgi:probable HAF family extracellular repeat protein